MSDIKFTKVSNFHYLFIAAIIVGSTLGTDQRGRSRLGSWARWSTFYWTWVR